MVGMKKLKVCWISAGVSSFIAGYLSRETVAEFIYIDIKDQHPDSIRFIKDCEKVLGKPIKILYPEYGDVDTACRVGGFINRPKVGAYCTKFLKKRVRKQWELEHSDYEITYVWGFDHKEKNRAQRITDTYPEFTHEFPLIEYSLSKNDCHALVMDLGIRRPVMYDLDTRTITVSDASRAVWVIGIRYVWTSQKYLNAVQSWNVSLDAVVSMDYIWMNLSRVEEGWIWKSFQNAESCVI